MIQFLLAPIPIALVWCAITVRFTPDGLALGYGIGLVVLALLRVLGIKFAPARSLDQPLAILIYTGSILVEALRSSLKVARLVLSPKIELKTGVVALESGDLSEDQLLTALSAHGINMTPGELVIDIADGGVLYVHCLEIEAARPHIESEQARRLSLLKRILGRPT